MVSTLQKYCFILQRKEIDYHGTPDVRFPALRLAGYPAKSVSVASALNIYRTRMVAQPEGAKSYLSLVDGITKLHLEGGLPAFYKGRSMFFQMVKSLINANNFIKTLMALKNVSILDT